MSENDAVTDFPDAVRPTRRQVRSRGNVLIQVWRFLVLNLKMLAMARKGHH